MAYGQLVQDGLAVIDLAQHAAQTLDVLPRPSRAPQHNGDLGLWHVHALVQHLGSDQHRVSARLKALQELLALSSLGLIGHSRDQVAAGDLVGHSVVFGEDQDPFLPVFAQQFVEHGQLPLRTGQQPLDALARQQGAAGSRVKGAEARQFPKPARAMRARQLALPHKSHVKGVVGIVATLFFFSQINPDALRAVLGKLFANQLVNAFFIDDGADEVGHAPAPILLFLRFRIGGSQPQPVTRGGHQGSLPPSGRR